MTQLFGGGGCPQHSLSFHVQYSAADVSQLAKEIKDETIAEVHLSLFTWWIVEEKEHYEQAKQHIRELGLDQGYQINRIPNVHLRKLLGGTTHIRPRSPYFATNPIARGLPAIPGRATRSESPPVELVGRTTSMNTALSRSTLSASRQVPPDTPDRPAPLNIQSRSHSTTPKVTILRSASTSIHSPLTPRSDSSTQIMWKEAGAQKLLISPTRTLSGASRDIQVVSSAGLRFIDDAADQDSRIFDGEIMQSNHGSHQHMVGGHFAEDLKEQAQAAIISSSSLATRPGAEHNILRQGQSLSSPLQKNHGAESINSEVVGGLRHSICPEAHQPILEIASETSIHVNQSQFRYTLPNPRSRGVIANPAPTPSQRRAAVQARRNAARTSNVASANNFHRPLPFRSYESEAFRFPTSTVQYLAEHNRSASMSPERGGRLLEMGALKEMTRRIGPSNLRVGPQSRNTSTTSLTTTHTSSVPVAEPEPFTSRTNLDDAYRTITSAFMTDALQRCRERGARLPTVSWDSLPPFEQTWRDINEGLIVSIYGRKNVAFTPADVTFVNRIKRELRDGVGRVPGYEWVQQLFN